jgi:hypothetical protein
LKKKMSQLRTVSKNINKLITEIIYLQVYRVLRLLPSSGVLKAQRTLRPFGNWIRFGPHLRSGRHIPLGALDRGNYQSTDLGYVFLTDQT